MLSRPNNPLDRMIQRFQHRWETNRQFRTTFSAVGGLVVVVVLCVCVGTASTLATRAMSSLEGSSTNNALGTPNTGVGQVSAASTFPTQTSGPLPKPNIPAASPIPNSQTPQPTSTAAPTPTDLPTATPCQVNCGGGGGGGHSNGTATGTPSPATWAAGQNVSFTVHTNPGNAGIALIISFPGGGTVLDENGETSDGNGNYTSHFTVPNGTVAGKADVYIQAYFSDGKIDVHVSVPCTA